ncbi:unnamed protein product [Nesidiocoris tenuis]|uniref:Molybdenum cofactor sulfurase middle domain-containing protein n=1 Tax=Nesidiocoris tenuis TaxID=355587 RepID=A0A6H5H6R2_9HEMI|nr:unnamed protein product [Nesidiocoris tenuis]
MEFISARTYPHLLQIEVGLATNGKMHLDYDGSRVEFEIPSGKPDKKIRLWTEQVPVVDCGDDVADWMTSVKDSWQSLLRISEEISSFVGHLLTKKIRTNGSASVTTSSSGTSNPAPASSECERIWSWKLGDCVKSASGQKSTENGPTRSIREVLPTIDDSFAMDKSIKEDPDGADSGASKSSKGEDAEPLIKVKRILTTMVNFVRDISPERGDRLAKAAVNLVSIHEYLATHPGCVIDPEFSPCQNSEVFHLDVNKRRYQERFRTQFTYYTEFQTIFCRSAAEFLIFQPVRRGIRPSRQPGWATTSEKATFGAGAPAGLVAVTALHHIRPHRCSTGASSCLRRRAVAKHSCHPIENFVEDPIEKFQGTKNQVISIRVAAANAGTSPATSTGGTTPIGPSPVGPATPIGPSPVAATPPIGASPNGAATPMGPSPNGATSIGTGPIAGAPIGSMPIGPPSVGASPMVGKHGPPMPVVPNAAMHKVPGAPNRQFQYPQAPQTTHHIQIQQSKGGAGSRGFASTSAPQAVVHHRPPTSVRTQSVMSTQASIGSQGSMSTQASIGTQGPIGTQTPLSQVPISTQVQTGSPLLHQNATHAQQLLQHQKVTEFQPIDRALSGSASYSPGEATSCSFGSNVGAIAKASGANSGAAITRSDPSSAFSSRREPMSSESSDEDEVEPAEFPPSPEEPKSDLEDSPVTPNSNSIGKYDLHPMPESIFSTFAPLNHFSSLYSREDVFKLYIYLYLSPLSRTRPDVDADAYNTFGTSGAPSSATADATCCNQQFGPWVVRRFAADVDISVDDVYSADRGNPRCSRTAETPP